ncbi:MAG: methylenetetrahydrofolate dehydrogenase [Gammaproteobacteria bacterium HGW-Gammaproteobacteria-3]|nr:MAG: methylenetetrahydrofolate dehydrogenase [Gammaproteobacteria bacterium HGW-Gammaproteobacteria-3]
MKKLLCQFDTDLYPSVFDTVVAYDAGADRVLAFGGVTPDRVTPLVEGALFTRAPKDKKNTAIFVGGSDMQAGQKLFTAVQKQFFSGFQVSAMLDSNGSNTTACAAVAKLCASAPLSGKKAVVLAGTGPVGQRAAALLALEGCRVALTSRQLARAEQACAAIKARFGVDIMPVAADSHAARGRAIMDANIVIATGAAGIELLGAEHWQNNAALEMIIDANATPPLGIGGIDIMARGEVRDGKIIWGAIGFGAFKLALHRACITKLFEDNKRIFDAETIFALAKTLV